MWRPEGAPRLLLMEGRTSSYAIEPRGEYVFGIVEDRPMRSRRGGERRVVEPGQLVAWDPTHAHAGAARDDEPWRSRLMVVEVGDLHGLAADEERDPLVDVEFPDPVVSDPAVVMGFRELHKALDRSATRLECEERLAEWLGDLVDRRGLRKPLADPQPRDRRALRLAMGYLADNPTRNVGLDELAAAAGIGKFRLIRLFRAHTGLPPHSLQLAHRVRAARRLIEAGHPIAEVAAKTGFADQSHLHRHFERSLGITPGEYRRRLD
jgi:AraC-like DNA-binding protein